MAKDDDEPFDFEQTMQRKPKMSVPKVTSSGPESGTKAKDDEPFDFEQTMQRKPNRSLPKVTIKNVPPVVFDIDATINRAPAASFDLDSTISRAPKPEPSLQPTKLEARDEAPRTVIKGLTIAMAKTLKLPLSAVPSEADPAGSRGR
jgi:hypothetical protein